MAQTLINGATQIKAASITVDRLVVGWDADFLLASGAVPLTGDWDAGLSGAYAITGLKDAVNPTDAVNLRTLQAFESGMGLRANARVVAVANVASLSGTPTIDGVALVAGNVILLTAQTTAAQNGPWVVAAGAWTRPTFWAAASSQRPALFFVTEGTTYDNSKWTTTTNGLITVDTTAVAIVQDTSGATYTNGSGLSLTGNTFAVKNGNGLSFDGSSNVQVVANATRLGFVDGSGVGLTVGTAGQFIVTNAGATAPAWVSMSGDVSLSSTGVATVNNTAGTGFLKYANIVANETPGGAVNGANTAFTLSIAPQVSSLQLYLNGMLLEPGAGNDYTISGANVTMLFAPATGDKLRAYFTK